MTKVSVTATDIPPKEIVTYAKQTQTVASPERGGMLKLDLIIARSCESRITLHSSVNKLAR